MSSSSEGPLSVAASRNAGPVAARGGRGRMDSLDALRGLVMVIMALDHTRDFVGLSGLDPRDVNDPVLFLTRWITHFCAPVFVFLAGTAAFLHGRKNPDGVGRFLWTRGLWLIVLEWTVVRIGWTFDIVPGFLPMQVIWVIGWSMVALSFLVRWARVSWIGALGVALIAGHNLLDGIVPTDLGRLGWLWVLVHGYGPLAPTNEALLPFVAYAFVPWVGVIAAGYAFGAVVVLPAKRRQRWMLWLGAGIVTSFVVLRALNGYGDPTPWVRGDTALGTLLSFINCEKYPPSLLFLLLTIGPSIALLGLADRGVGRIGQPFVVVGRVPLAYYVLHVYLIHLAAIAITAATGGPLDTLWSGFHPMWKSAGVGFPLPVVYAVWIGVVLALYPFCAWFSGVKRRRGDWWLSYL